MHASMENLASIYLVLNDDGVLYDVWAVKLSAKEQAKENPGYSVQQVFVPAEDKGKVFTTLYMASVMWTRCIPTSI